MMDTVIRALMTPRRRHDIDATRRRIIYFRRARSPAEAHHALTALFIASAIYRHYHAIYYRHYFSRRHARAAARKRVMRDTPPLPRAKTLIFMPA